MSFERAGETLTGNSGSITLRRKVGPRFVSMTLEQLPPGSIVRLYTKMTDGDEVVTDLLFLGDALPADTPTPTPPPPTPTPTPRSALPDLSEYSPLLAKAASNLPAGYDFVRDGLTADEREVLDWADSRLFSNPSFLGSIYGPDNWPAQVRERSVQAILLLMMEIDIQVKADGRHVVGWEVDALDRVLDAVDVYPGLCVHCYGKTGYDTRETVFQNYIAIIREDGHAHRAMLKAFAYFAKADGEGILVRSFMDNDSDDLELLHKRETRGSSIIGVGSYGYGFVNFMSQIELPDGTLESYPTMAFKMAGDAATERQAVERVYDYMRFRMKHFTGDLDDFANIYRPYTVTPYAPELGWVVYVGEAGSPSSAAVITGAFRALGLKAEQFRTPKRERNAGSVEADGETYYYNGNDFFRVRRPRPVCILFKQELDHVDDNVYDVNCDPSGTSPPYRPDEPVSPDRTGLVALYNATGGPGWERNDNWLSERPIGEWFGVGTYNGRVTHLDLSGNGLSGQLPNALWDLQSLTALYLGGNQITGGIPPGVGELRYLRDLYLHDNRLSGEIPPELANATSLVELAIRENSLSGAIPPEMGNLPYLRYLDVGANPSLGCVPQPLQEALYTYHDEIEGLPVSQICKQ